MNLKAALTPEQLDMEWSSLQAFLQAGPPEDLVQAVMKRPSARERNQILRFAVKKIGGATGASTADLDFMLHVGRKAVAHALEQARDGDSEFWLQEANLSCYNTAANLCDCWGDGDTRTNDHFWSAVLLVEQALELRKELKKGPAAFAMAYWLLGKHLLSLRESERAVQTFELAYQAEKDARKEADGPKHDASLWMARVYLAMAMEQGGTLRDDGLHESILGLKELARTNPDAREDAQLYLDAIEESKKRNLKAF